MNLVEKLKEVQIIRHGTFILKNGKESSVYFDFRRLISYPKLLTEVCYQLSLLIKDKDVTITGVPIGGIPYACFLSTAFNLPMIIVRPDKKEYGLKNLIEGDDFGRDIIIVEDVITTGQSVIDIIKLLEEQGKRIRKIIVILDRDNIVNKIKSMGYNIQCLFTIQDFSNKIDS